MEIGSWGKTIVFEVSDKKILNFTGMQRRYSAKWAEHQIPGEKPKHEFIGVETPEVKLTIALAAYRGVKPRTMLKNIEKACKAGATEYLMLGGKRVGSNKYYIKSISETWNEVWNRGELVKATASITFLEYR